MSTIYSNYDHQLDKAEVDKAMEDGEPRDHTAYNFCGHITYDKQNKVWREEVYRYRALVESRENINLEELIESINEDYGCE